jgi:protein TonB
MPQPEQPPRETLSPKDSTAPRIALPPDFIPPTRPQYPEEAFIKKVEGTVLLEILINVDGRVAHAEDLRSIPLLDEAALATVQQWLFEPALKNGRPVATLARAPISFTIC